MAKIRLGFVSNSSSSSFTINKHYISGYQLDKIRNRELDPDDNWRITENEDNIEFYSFMDNFDMYEYLTEKLHIAKEYINWGD